LLYAVVGPETNELLHISLEQTTNTVLAQTFLTEIGEKYDVSEAVFLIDEVQSLQTTCYRDGYDLRYNNLALLKSYSSDIFVPETAG